MQTWPPTHRPQCIQCPIQKEDVTAAINKNHSSLFYPKRGKLEGMVAGRPFPLHQRHRAVPCGSNHCLSPFHCLTSVTHRYFFSFYPFFLYLFFGFSPMQFFIPNNIHSKRVPPRCVGSGRRREPAVFNVKEERCAPVPSKVLVFFLLIHSTF